jgi:hypothetical protein
LVAATTAKLPKGKRVQDRFHGRKDKSTTDMSPIQKKLLIFDQFLRNVRALMVIIHLIQLILTWL